MDEFNALLLEGLFKTIKDQLLLCLDGKEPTSVEQALQPFVGQSVQFALHHVPPMPPDPEKWGGGCCHWQGEGECPSGHSEHPERILNVHGQGTLRRKEGAWDQDVWVLEQFDGTEKRLPLQFLPGHDARIACVTLFDVEKMRDSLSNMDLGDVEAIGQQATDLKGILQQMKDIGEKKS